MPQTARKSTTGSRSLNKFSKQRDADEALETRRRDTAFQDSLEEENQPPATATSTPAAPKTDLPSRRKQRPKRLDRHSVQKSESDARQGTQDVEVSSQLPQSVITKASRSQDYLRGKQRFRRRRTPAERYHRVLLRARHHENQETVAPVATCHGAGSGKGGIKRMAKIMIRDKERRDVQLVEQIKSISRKPTWSIALAPFARAIGQILKEVQSGRLDSGSERPKKFHLAAIDALREGTELFLVAFFEKCYWATVHDRRVTLMRKDLDLTRMLLNHRFTI